MNLTDLMPAPTELKITFPDGEPTDIVLEVVSADSRQFHAVISEQAQAQLMRDAGYVAPIAERQLHTAAQVASCIVGWRGLEDQGIPITYSKAKAIELMNTPELAYVREQVEGFVSKRANFFRRGPKPASNGGAAAGTAEHAPKRPKPKAGAAIDSSAAHQSEVFGQSH